MLSGVKLKEKPSVLKMVVAFVTQVVMAGVLSMFIVPGDITTGLKVGILLWVGFVATVTLGSVLWKEKSWVLWALNNAYNVINISLMAIIIVVWA